MATAAPNQQASCADNYDPASMPADAAREHILSTVEQVELKERINLRNALDRVLAEDIHSPIDVPGHNNSAMDGFALRSQDLPTEESKLFDVVGSSFAGHPFDQAVAENQCIRIMTGGVMPDGADTVVMQEHVELKDNQALIGSGHSPGQNVRMAGEDVAAGECVLKAGKFLYPADIGVLASFGIAEVGVKRRLRVAFFSTGDELVSIGETPKEGQIYDSNRYTLYGMLERLNTDIIDMGVIRDDRDDIRQAFKYASENADVLITSGGVSVGEADYVQLTLAELGHTEFWKIAMKPGRPLAYGNVGSARFFGLPGNPVSVMVTFYQFVQPALQKMMGLDPKHPIQLKVRCVSRLRKRPGRTEYQRGILEIDATGEMAVRTTGPQGSGMLNSMSQANCFIVLPQDSGPQDAGSIVTVEPFADII